MILLWVAVIVGIGWTAIYFFNKREEGHTSSQSSEEKSPEEIARHRYARGEIDKEELEEILQNLKERK